MGGVGGGLEVGGGGILTVFHPRDGKVAVLALLRAQIEVHWRGRLAKV